MSGEPARVLRIKDWSAIFENHRTRGLQRMEWVLLPNKMDGLGYTELVSHPDGAAHFGAWVAMLEIASRQRPKEKRGTLPSIRGNTAAALARLSRFPQELFEAVIERLLSDEIGWLEEVPAAEIAQPVPSGATPRESGATPRTPGAEARESGIERNGMERNGTELRSAAPAPDSAAHPDAPLRESVLAEECVPEPEAAPGGWMQAVEAASRAGMVIDPSPDSQFCQKEWMPAPLERRLACIRGIYERIDCGQFGPLVDPQYVPAFRNFFRQSGWNETLRPRASPKLDRKAAARAEFRRRLEEELADAKAEGRTVHGT